MTGSFLSRSAVLKPGRRVKLLFWTTFWPIYRRGKHIISTQGRVDAVYQYWRRGGRHSVITQGEVRDGLLLRKEVWEVVVIINATDQGFDLLFVCQDFYAGLQRIFLSLSCECETTTLTLNFNCCWKYCVYDPSLLSYACGTISQLLRVSVCLYSIYLPNLSTFLLSLTLSDKIMEFLVLGS